MIKAISFDLDGTLADENFDKRVWNEEIPRLYAAKHRLSLTRATEAVFADYYRAGYVEGVRDWTNIEYWMKRLRLGPWKPIIARMKKEVFVYPDALSALNALKPVYPLVIVSNSHLHFLNAKLEAEGLKRFFTRTFSAPSFASARKNRDLYATVLNFLKIRPNELVHVGDDHELDYNVPKEMGIHAFHLLRGKRRPGKHELTSLEELPDRIKSING